MSLGRLSAVALSVTILVVAGGCGTTTAALKAIGWLPDSYDHDRDWQNGKSELTPFSKSGRYLNDAFNQCPECVLEKLSIAIKIAAYGASVVGASGVGAVVTRAAIVAVLDDAADRVESGDEVTADDEIIAAGYRSLEPAGNDFVTSLELLTALKVVMK